LCESIPMLEKKRGFVQIGGVSSEKKETRVKGIGDRSGGFPGQESLLHKEGETGR